MLKKHLDQIQNQFDIKETPQDIHDCERTKAPIQQTTIQTEQTVSDFELGDLNLELDPELQITNQCKDIIKI